MSTVLNKLHDADQPSPPRTDWYLRTDDTDIYGPVDIAVLREWSAQSRIAPGNQVSNDGELWVAAETLPELKMEWMAELPDGRTYGPFNVLAVPNLFETGSLPASAVLTHPTTGKTLKVADILRGRGKPDDTPQPAAVPSLDMAKQEQWQKRYEDEKQARLQHEAELQGEIEALKAKALSAEEELARAHREIDREAQELHILEIDRSSKEKRHSDSIARLERQLSEQRETENRLKQVIAEKDNSVKDERSASEEASRKLRNEISSLNSRIESLSLSLKKQELAASEKQSALDSHLKRWTQLEKELRGEIEQLRTSAIAKHRKTDGAPGGSAEDIGASGALQPEPGSSEPDIARRLKTEHAKCVELEHNLASLRRNHDQAAEQSKRRETELTRQVSAISAELEASRASAEQLKNENSGFRDKIVSLENSSETARLNIEGVQGQLSQLNEHYELLKSESRRQLEELEAQRESFSHEKAELEKANSMLEGDRASLMETVERLKAGLEDSDSSTTTLQLKLSSAVSELQEFRKQASAEADSLRTRIAELDTKLKVAGDQAALSADRISDASSSAAALRKQAEETEKQLTAEISSLRQDIDRQKQGFEAELSQERSRREEIERLLSQAREDVQSDSSVLHKARERIAELERRLSESEAGFVSEKQKLQLKLAEAEETAASKAESLIALESRLAMNTSERSLEVSGLAEQVAALEREKARLKDDYEARISSLTASIERETVIAADLRKNLSAGEASTAALKSSVLEAETAAGDLRKRLEEKSAEAEKADRERELLEKTVAQLRDDIAAKNSLLSRESESFGMEADDLKKQITEKDGTINSLTGKAETLSSQLEDASTRLRKLQEAHGILQDESARRESELRARISESADQLGQLRKSTDLRIAELQQTASTLKADLETSRREYKDTARRLDDSLARITGNEKAAEREKRSLESQIHHLREKLSEKIQALEETDAVLYKTEKDTTDSERSLRETLRMLEKREIAGRKQSAKLTSRISQLEQERTKLTADNNALVEEVKDAVAQLKLLRRQVEPLRRRADEQELLLRKQLARGTPEASASSAALAFEKLKHRTGLALHKLAASGPAGRIAILTAAVILVLVMLKTNGKPPARPEAPAGNRRDMPETALETDRLQEYIKACLALKPELALKPAETISSHREAAGTRPLPDIQAEGVAVLATNNQQRLVFKNNVFSEALSFSGDAEAVLRKLAADSHIAGGPFKLVIHGLSEPGAAETGGNQSADYSLRIRRADAVRKILLESGNIPSSRVLIAAGRPDPGMPRSVMIVLQHSN